MRNNVIKLFVAIMAFVALSFYAKCSHAEQPVNENTIRSCVDSAQMKAIVRSAAIGGGILVIGAGIAIATSPVSIPVAAGVGIVTSNLVVGGLIGASSSLATRISDSVYFKENAGDPLVYACLEKTSIAALKNFKKDAEKALNGVVQRF